MSKLRLNLVMVMEETLETERRQGSGLEVAHLQTFFTAKQGCPQKKQPSPCNNYGRRRTRLEKGTCTTSRTTSMSTE